MTRAVILLDVATPLVDRLFDPEDQARLERLGDVVRRSRAAGDPVAGYDVVVTGWGSAPLPDDRGPADRLRLVAHSAVVQNVAALALGTSTPAHPRPDCDLRTAGSEQP